MHGIEPSAKEQKEGCMQRTKKRRLLADATRTRKTLLARVAFFKSKATSIGPAILSTLSRPAILGTVALVVTCLSWLAAGPQLPSRFSTTFSVHVMNRAGNPLNLHAIFLLVLGQLISLTE